MKAGLATLMVASGILLSGPLFADSPADRQGTPPRAEPHSPPAQKSDSGAQARQPSWTNSFKTGVGQAWDNTVRFFHAPDDRQWQQEQQEQKEKKGVSGGGGIRG